jgi:uncharacterized protein (TIGR04255 family)
MVAPMKQPQDIAGKGRVKFEHPPVNEVAMGIYYVPVTELKAQHIGIYWNSIRERYPICEQQIPVVTQSEGQPPMLAEAPGEIFPLPRFWFLSKAHAMLIQVQRNAFLLNWRRTSSEDYPHYENVEKDFWQEFAKYKDFVQGIGGRLDVVQRCELTYVNLISPSAFFSTPAELGAVFPPIASLCEVQDEERKLIGLSASSIYQLSDNLLIESAIKWGKRLDTSELVAVFELKAQGTPRDLSLEGAAAWFSNAHDGIYKLFLDLTNREVQEKVWRPQ